MYKYGSIYIFICRFYFYDQSESESIECLIPFQSQIALFFQMNTINDYRCYNFKTIFFAEENHDFLSDAIALARFPEIF